MALSTPEMLVGTLSIIVLGLDPHEFDIQWNTCNQGADSYDHLGKAKGYKNLLVGTLHKSDLPDVVNRFNEIFTEALSRKRDQRSAAGNEQGHQKTPAFILALLKQAVQNNGKTFKPKGGFTDNGLHTGGKPRNTSFPLVGSLFEFRLTHASKGC